MSEMIDFSSALQRAFDLGDKAATAQYEAENKPNIVEHDGASYLYFRGKLTQIEPAEIYHPETFYASTLEGLCDYIQADSDEQFVTDQPAPLVVVESPVRVNVYGMIVGEKKERPLLASCEYEAPEIAIGQYIDAESLFINIQSCFVADENRDLVCKVVNNMTEEQSVQTADDGISQRVISQGWCSGSRQNDLQESCFPAPDAHVYRSYAASVSVCCPLQGGQESRAF